MNQTNKYFKGVIVGLLICLVGYGVQLAGASGKFNLPLSWILNPSGTSVDTDNDGLIDNSDQVDGYDATTTVAADSIYASDASGYLPDGAGNITINSGSHITGGATIGLQSSMTLDVSDDWVDIGGDTMSGALDMGTNKITSVDTPTADSDVATKSYVDDNTAVNCPDYVQDVEGNGYNTVHLGNGQCWMTENMYTTTYPDGTAITKGDAAHGAAGWDTDSGYYSCPPNSTNDGEDCAAADSLGMLYQWSAAMDDSTAEGAQGICPTGWHVPTDAEQYALENYLQTSGTCSSTRIGWECDPAGAKLCGNDASDANWTSGTMTGHADFDTSGFNAPPAGIRYTTGSYLNRSYNTLLWSSTESGSNAWRRTLNYDYSTLIRSDTSKACGFSVRCIKN